MPYESFEVSVSQDLEVIIPKFKDINFGCTMLSEVNTFQLDETTRDKVFYIYFRFIKIYYELTKKKEMKKE